MELLNRRIRGKRLSHILIYLKANLLVYRILKTVDLEKFRVYQDKYRDADRTNQGYSKYLDIRSWMTDKLMYFYLLGLHKSGPLKILDLGSGVPYFSYICSLHGHQVVSIDLDTVPMYNEMCKFFNADRRTLRIEKFQRLPDLGLRFNLVTAFGIKFNLHGCEDEWNIDEWRFLINDLRSQQLIKNGRIFLAFNSNREGFFHNETLLKWFLEIGGMVYHRYVDIGPET